MFSLSYGSSDKCDLYRVSVTDSTCLLLTNNKELKVQNCYILLCCYRLDFGYKDKLF